jgi:Uma2 family endonuclease
VLEAPPHMVAEIVHGALELHPRPAPRHAWASSRIGGRLGRAFDDDDGAGPGGWIILDEPELHLGGDVLVPDLAGWRRERMPALPEGAWFELAPDWVCEVPSPSTRRLDLTGKRAAYAREGVGFLWFVDPDARTLEGFALREGSWVLLGALAGEAAVRMAPFEALEWPLGALWA